jgi:D-sedoheptulose 7-phosphate isomerase
VKPRSARGSRPSVHPSHCYTFWMDLTERIVRQFADSTRAIQKSGDALLDQIALGAEVMFEALSNDHKILACGNGGSAAGAQHLAANLVGRFERERLSLAAVALSTDTSLLTAVANDYGYEDVFAKQVAGLGRGGDVLFAISTSGNSRNVVAAIDAAIARDLRIVALTGKGGGAIGEILRDRDVHICVPHDRTARIQEVHLLVLHCLCDGIDWHLLGDDS